MRTSLTIGDFSRMTVLSVKALRHYHEIGLLRPADVDPQTGYRRYDVSQVPAAQVIRRLRELGMSLDEVRIVMEAPDHGLRGRYMAAAGLSWWAGLALAPTLGTRLLDVSAPLTFAACALAAAGARFTPGPAPPLKGV